MNALGQIDDRRAVLWPAGRGIESAVGIAGQVNDIGQGQQIRLFVNVEVAAVGPQALFQGAGGVDVLLGVFRTGELLAGLRKFSLGVIAHLISAGKNARAHNAVLHAHQKFRCRPDQAGHIERPRGGIGGVECAEHCTHIDVVLCIDNRVASNNDLLELAAGCPHEFDGFGHIADVLFLADVPIVQGGARNRGQSCGFKREVVVSAAFRADGGQPYAFVPAAHDEARNVNDGIRVGIIREGNCREADQARSRQIHRVFDQSALCHRTPLL